MESSNLHSDHPKVVSESCASSGWKRKILIYALIISGYSLGFLKNSYANEGGNLQPSAVLVVTENLLGKDQKTELSESLRSFISRGLFVNFEEVSLPSAAAECGAAPCFQNALNTTTADKLVWISIAANSSPTRKDKAAMTYVFATSIFGRDGKGALSGTGSEVIHCPLCSIETANESAFLLGVKLRPGLISAPKYVEKKQAVEKIDETKPSSLIEKDRENEKKQIAKVPSPISNKKKAETSPPKKRRWKTFAGLGLGIAGLALLTTGSYAISVDGDLACGSKVAKKDCATLRNTKTKGAVILGAGIGALAGGVLLLLWPEAESGAKALSGLSLGPVAHAGTQSFAAFYRAAF